MLGIVQTNSEDILARPRDRCEQIDIALGKRGADQIGSGRRRDGLLQEAQRDRPEVDEIEHRRGHVIADRIAEIFDVDHEAVVEKAEPRFGLDRAICHEAHV